MNFLLKYKADETTVSFVKQNREVLSGWKINLSAFIIGKMEVD